MDVKVIGTHSGPFHADDVMACALLQLHPEFKDAKIERSREEGVLEKCDIILDVGGKFGHEERRYDHHQADFVLTMEQLSRGEIKSKVKLSSAGLIFFYYGQEIIREHFELEELEHLSKINWIWKKIYFILIREIDLIDNTGSVQGDIKTGFTTRVGRLNPDWGDPDPDFDHCFSRAVDIASEEFISNLKTMESQWRAKLAVTEKVLKRYEDHSSGRVLIFEKHTMWNSIIGEVEEDLGIEGKMLFVVNPRPENNEFSVSIVHRRCLFPIQWRGVREEELKKETRLAGAKFVHSGGHLAILRNKEDALTLVDMMLEKHDYSSVSERNSVIEKLKNMRLREAESSGFSKTAGVWRRGGGAWRKGRDTDGRGGDRRTLHS